MKTNTTHSLKWKRMLALLAAVAAILTMLVLPTYAKTSDGFQYYVDGPYEDDGEAFAIITGHRAAVNGTLTVPAKLGGVSVWSIAEGAFADRADVTKVVVADSVGYVGAHAFENCANLRTLVIGSAYIRDYAFDGCDALREVRITAYKDGYFDPEDCWEADGNDTLLNADRVWTHYGKDYDVAQSEIKTRNGAKLTLTAAYDDLKNGDTYRWYSAYGYAFYPDTEDGWEGCAGRKVSGTVNDSDEQIVVCEVVDSKGDVVWAQAFHISARATLAQKAERAWYNTYLYGVTEYTVNHFRWRIMDVLDAMGIDVYELVYGC